MCRYNILVLQVLSRSNVRTDTREISIWLKFVCWVKHFRPLSRARFNLMHHSIPSGSVCTSASRGSLFCCSTNRCLCWGPLEMRQSSFDSIFLSMCATFFLYDMWKKTKIDPVFIDTVIDGEKFQCCSVTSVEAICYFCSDTYDFCKRCEQQTCSCYKGAAKIMHVCWRTVGHYVALVWEIWLRSHRCSYS